MKKMFACLLVLVLVMSLAACGSDDTNDNRITVSKSSSDLEGEDYKDVMTMLQVAGFSNIEVEVLDDLITGWLTKDGEVEKVSINGETSFSASSRFPPDSKIMITYHTFPSKETEPVQETTAIPETTESTDATETPGVTESVETSESQETDDVSAESLDLNAINSTNSAESDAQFVGKYYRVIGIIDQAMESSDGFNAMVIIEPDIMAKGMGSTLPLEINIWLTEDEFEKIGGISSVGKQIDISVELVSISRNAISDDPDVKGYPIQLEFGEYD